LEVHLRKGGHGYDVIGNTQTQLIDDVLRCLRAETSARRSQPVEDDVDQPVGRGL
jgi:hypothetical protein